MTFTPKFSITPRMAADLMSIQSAAATVDFCPLPANIVTELKRQSRMETVILSTKIEGNRLEPQRKRAAIVSAASGREEQEVHNLAKALDFLDGCAERNTPITEDLIKQLHGIIRVIEAGRRPRYSEYRTVQNKIGEAGSNAIVYLPPEPQDVPALMADLVAWASSAATVELPAPVVAGIFMYQLLTVHPYLDGNGRTARALATYILKRAGLGLRGLLVLERYYDRDLTGYYANLQMGLSHNYYFGRNNADLTPWLSFFIAGLADVFIEAARLVRAKSDEYLTPEPELLRRLDPYQRQLFSQLALHRDRLTVTDVSNLTGLAGRTVREKLHAWIADGFVQAVDPGAQRIRSVTLTAPYRELAVEVANDPKRYPYLLG